MECRPVILALCLSLVCFAAQSCNASFLTSDFGTNECAVVCHQQLPRTADGSSCINSSRALYSALVVILRDELEWRSFRDMFYVTLLTPTNGTNASGNDSCGGDNCTRAVSTIVFAKSVAFFLVRADTLKSIITPWLSTFGLFLPDSVEQIYVTIPPLECEGRNSTTSIIPDMEEIIELASQRAVSGPRTNLASFYAAVYSRDIIENRRQAFTVILSATLVALAIMTCSVSAKHTHQLTRLILSYGRSGPYHGFVVFTVTLGGMMTVIFWIVWLIVIFAHLGLDGMLLLGALGFGAVCSIVAVAFAIKNLQLKRCSTTRQWCHSLAVVPLGVSIVVCAQFLGFLLPFIALSLISWPLLTTSVVLFTYSLSCCCYGGMFIIFVVAIVTVSVFVRQHKNCLLGLLIVLRDVLILSSAMTAGTGATLITGYFLMLLFAGTHQDRSSFTPFLIGVLGSLGTALVTYAIHLLLKSLEKKKTKRAGAKPVEKPPERQLVDSSDGDPDADSSDDDDLLPIN